MKGQANLKDLISSMEANLEDIAPNFKKGMLSVQDKEKIIEKIASDLDISKASALAGTILLLLKGAASGGTPATLSIELKGEKTIAKKNVLGAYLSVTGNQYIRRLAESLAIEIGEFAEKFELNGELATRINTILKAETGEKLTTKEAAWCSSFSQEIPDLAIRSSDRLVRLLAEDYKKRFENKKTKVVNEKTRKQKRK